MAAARGTTLSRSDHTRLEASADFPARLDASTWLVLAALWVLAHPWIGFNHDGLLYAGQAMAYVRPEVFGRDLFFAHGSQDDYTVFGRVYGAAVGFGGLTGAARTLWGAAQALWFLAATAWTARAVAREHLLPVAACVFALPGFYSADKVFRLAESFLTARSFAEPLALGAVLLVALGWRWLGAAALAGATLVHPIIALPATVIAGLLAFPQSVGTWRRIAFGAAAALVAAGLAISHLGGRLERMDNEWYSILAVGSPYLLLDQWQPFDWIRQLFPILLLAMVARRVEPKWARIWHAFAACATLGLVLTAVAWCLRWEFGIQVQFWRFGWLASWAAPLAALQLAASRAVGRAQRIVLCATIPALALTSMDWWPLAWLLPLLCLVFLSASLWEGDREGRVGSLAASAIAGLLGAAALAGGVLAVLAVGFSTRLAGQAHDAPLGAVAATYLGWAALPCAVWIALRISGSNTVGAGRRLAAVAFAAIAVAGLDARTVRAVTLDRLIDDGLPTWTAAIPPDSSVLWPEHLGGVWLALRRQSYVSRAQLAGVVFNRSVAVEGVRRMDQVRPIAGRDAIVGFREAAGAAPAGSPTSEDLGAACAAAPLLDFVVATLAPARPIVAPYADPATGEVFHLHRCADLRGS